MTIGVDTRDHFIQLYLFIGLISPYVGVTKTMYLDTVSKESDHLGDYQVPCREKLRDTGRSAIKSGRSTSASSTVATLPQELDIRHVDVITVAGLTALSLVGAAA